MTWKTEQEGFWGGDFGDEYTGRNRAPRWLAARIAFFHKALAHAGDLTSALELGSNYGLNMQALSQMFPGLSLSAVEINKKAASELAASMPEVDLHNTSILEFEPHSTWDLVFTKGVLIHLNPEALPDVYDLMYRCSNRYVLVAEYYNPVPVEAPYRGHSGKLFKRDFAGDMMDAFSDLTLVDYGFVYHRDRKFPQDDMSWFLLEKS